MIGNGLIIHKNRPSVGLDRALSNHRHTGRATPRVSQSTQPLYKKIGTKTRFLRACAAQGPPWHPKQHPLRGLKRRRSAPRRAPPGHPCRRDEPGRGNVARGLLSASGGATGTAAEIMQKSVKINQNTAIKDISSFPDGITDPVKTSEASGLQQRHWGPSSLAESQVVPEKLIKIAVRIKNIGQIQASAASSGTLSAPLMEPQAWAGSSCGSVAWGPRHPCQSHSSGQFRPEQSNTKCSK